MKSAFVPITRSGRLQAWYPRRSINQKNSTKSKLAHPAASRPQEAVAIFMTTGTHRLNATPDARHNSPAPTISKAVRSLGRPLRRDWPKIKPSMAIAVGGSEGNKVPMRDGVRLSADILFPNGQARKHLPVVNVCSAANAN